MMEARTITIALGGSWYGRYGLTFCPAHGNSHTPALSLKNGTDGRLLAHCHAGCAFTEILDALRARGLIEGRGNFTEPDLAARREADARERALAEKRARQAHRLWRDEAMPIGSTPAERYLRHRGITCDLPDTLRYHPSCWHPSAKRFPALLALIEGADNFAVHRTYLLPDGRKADVNPPKAMLGSVLGGAVRLSDGPDGLVIAEGIETALSLGSGLMRGHPTIWAALSTSGMASLRLPDRPGKLTVATDGDAAGREAGHKLAERAHALGWRVSTLPAPEGCDWNDVLCRKEVPA